MTLEELKQTIDEYIGLHSELEVETSRDSAKLVYRSRNGLRLFDIAIGDYEKDGTWEFGGHSGAISDSWTILCRIHKVTK